MLPNSDPDLRRGTEWVSALLTLWSEN